LINLRENGLKCFDQLILTWCDLSSDNQVL
jgi:hypothetical protein